MDSKDKQILQYVCENFSCTVCNNILIQCMTLSCGHHYCNYCLDLLLAGMLTQCPQCSTPIQQAQPNHPIDRQIDNLIHSCSESIQKTYASALNSRFQKSMDRKKSRHNEERSFPKPCEHSSEPKMLDCLDEIRHKLQRNDINPLQAVTKSLKSARNSKNLRRSASSCGPQSKPLHFGLPKACESESEIDMNKVNLLFGIYDHVLNSGNNVPNKEMGAGDYFREEDETNLEFPILESMNNFTIRSEAELETLIKETDDIIRLDGHIQKWTNKMKDALSGSSECSGIADERFDNNSVHVVNDELWKASSQLLLKLQGIQKQRQSEGKSSLSFSCPPTPRPRSYKLNVDVVSDDSDAEEYEQALESLQHSLDSSYDLMVQTRKQESNDSEYQNKGEISRKIEANAGHAKDGEHRQKGTLNKNTSGNRSARKKSLLDSVEESGHNYIKENIDFITKMRKYKEALIKIQNREVVSAQEIKELLPTRTFPDCPDEIAKCEDATTPRRLSHITRGSRRNHSYSARLPSSTKMDSRPLTATYDAPSTQLIHKQIAVAPTKQYLKQRSRASNSLYTAR